MQEKHVRLLHTLACWLVDGVVEVLQSAPWMDRPREKRNGTSMVIQQVRDCMRRTTGIGVAIAMVGTGALLAVPMAANAAEDTGQTTLPAKTDVQVIAFQ